MTNPVDHDGFWAARRVMVTGGEGFMGRYVVGALKRRRASVFIVAHRSGRGLRAADAEFDAHAITVRLPDCFPNMPRREVD